MINNSIYNYPLLLTAACVLVLAWGCSREIDELEPATFPRTAEVFIDGFSAGLEYAAFGDSKLTAFSVDTDIKYDGEASMQFAVPDAGDPEGGYAGGVFLTSVGRDLTNYDVLTFWARATRSATINEIGFGNDFGESRHLVVLNDVSVNTNWKKYYIPLPDPSLLLQERGMFFYSEGPEDGEGYTFWIDEVQFEQLGTLTNPRAAILAGLDQEVEAETGDRLPIGGLTYTVTLPNGANQTANIAPAYFEFTSSNTSVATVSELGIVTVLEAGEAEVTATRNGQSVPGSLTVRSTGPPLLPPVPAPTPIIGQDSVISMFSNAYTNVKVDTWNPFWEFSTAEVSDVQIGTNDVKRYKNLNFVGILTEMEPIDASNMTHFHMDIWTPDPTAPPAVFRVLLVDFGANGVFGGGDDSSHELVFTSPTLQTETWVSLDIPLSNFAGLTNRANIGQLVISGDLPNLFVDNVYYYINDTTVDTEPSDAAPTPNRAAANVISLFSDAYDDVPVDTWRTGWSVAEFEDVEINGNATKKYSMLDFVGIETVANKIDASNMTHFHIDVWSPDFTSFGIKLVDVGADGDFGGGDDVEHQVNVEKPAQGEWLSLDIPLSEFTGLTTTSNIAQLILVGRPILSNTIYVDNIYFYNEGGSNATEPQGPAPTPTLDAADVISLFSDAYSDVTVDTWLTPWSSAALEDIAIDGNATKKYLNLDVVGIETMSNTVDASDMTHFHIDVWSPDFTTFSIKLVDFGADGAFGGGDDSEHQIDIENPIQGNWVSLDIPLSEFTGLASKSNMAQYILVGQPTRMTTVYVDNVYFHK